MDEKVKEIEEFDEYDSGLLNNFGGGNFEWWWDYIRSEVGRANERGKSQYEFLLSHIKKLQQDIDREITYKEALEQAEVKIEELEEGIEKHHNKKLEIKKFFANISENHPQAQQIPDGADEELYGLLKEKRK